MLRTPVCSYPIIVTHLSFNFLCLLLLYNIYLPSAFCTRLFLISIHILSSKKGVGGGGDFAIEVFILCDKPFISINNLKITHDGR
jgi:hypothetical protein